MRKRPKPTEPVIPFILNSIYRVNEAQDILGIGRATISKLKREGLLEVRTIGRKQYIRSNDLWDAMESTHQHKPIGSSENIRKQNTVVEKVITVTNAVLTEEEAAEFLKIKKSTLAQERLRGRIKPYRIVRNRIRYTYEILNDYIKNHPLNEQ